RLQALLRRPRSREAIPARRQPVLERRLEHSRHGRKAPARAPIIASLERRSARARPRQPLIAWTVAASPPLGLPRGGRRASHASFTNRPRFPPRRNLWSAAWALAAGLRPRLATPFAGVDRAIGRS